MSGLAPKWVRLAPKWVRLAPSGKNLGLFQIRFEHILAGVALTSDRHSSIRRLSFVDLPWCRGKVVIPRVITIFTNTPLFCCVYFLFHLIKPRFLFIFPNLKSFKGFYTRSPNLHSRCVLLLHSVLLSTLYKYQI